jgi:hemoglobin
MKDLTTREDVHELVDEFYKRVRAHDVLAPIFNEKIGQLWFLHIDTLTRFWETLLLENRTYFGAPFPKHLELPIEDVHFDMWLGLFTQTVSDLFEGEKADEAKHRAVHLAKSFKNKMKRVEQSNISW